MNRISTLATAISVSFSLGFFVHSFFPPSKPEPKQVENMKLGAFSVSLSVKDLSKSKEFYENLGFSVFGGDMKNNYLIMKNERTLIGLFQGMFEENILTFNPGWDENAKKVEGFQDVRKIQQHLKSAGVEIINPADENSEGPASFVVKDPDGNMILFDQHL
ncbi:Catechol 2,3-dioxygenase [Algoriphagus locisalis]|uniref:Catechol 2,3-dioxygenase n=2 Tax=Algoriphagus locisalis TaxID=305507 RepID=A0A1I6ZWX9_9BACT|nr:Catechol 2,3-dioxygenase [Algoriphagus locisalis]